MLSLAIDNTNTPNRAPRSEIGMKVRSDALRSSDAGSVLDPASAPAESVPDAISATHSNSRVPSSRANKAGGGSSSPVAGTHSNLQVLSVPVDVTGEGFPAILQPSPVIHSHSTGATVASGDAARSAVGVAGTLYTRPAPFDGSGDEPSVPSFADGGAKMLDGCSRPAGRADAASGFSHAQAKQVVTHPTWSPWSVCKGSI